MTRLIQEALSQEQATPSQTPSHSAHRSAELALAVESATLEIQEAEHEVTMEEYRISELEHAHASLEAIATSLESITAEDERGLDRFSAEGFRHATYAIVGDAMENPIPSLESFGGNTESAMSTEAAKDKVVEMAKKIWESIKQAVRKAIEAVTDFMKKLFEGAEKLHKRTEDLEAQIAEYKKNGYVAASDATFEVPFASRVFHNNSLKFDDLAEGTTLIKGTVLAYGEKFVEEAQKYYKGVADFYTSIPDDTNPLIDQSNKLAEALQKVGKKYKVESMVLPGGKVYHVKIEEKELDGKKFYYAKSPRIVDSDSAKEPKETSIDVPTLDELEAVAANLKAAASSLMGSKDNRQALKDARKEAYKAAEKLVKEIEDGNVATKWEQAKIRFAMKAVESDFVTGIARADNYTFNYVRAMVSVVDKALKQYGEPESGGSNDEE